MWSWNGKCLSCSVFSNMFLCSEFPDILDKRSRRTATRSVITKRYAFQANVKRNIVLRQKKVFLKTTWKPNYHDYNRDWKNLNLQSWKSGLAIINILTVLDKKSTCHHKNFILLSSNSRIVIIENSICHHENVGLSSWSFQLFIIRCRPIIMKISTVHNRIMTCHHEILSSS